MARFTAALAGSTSLATPLAVAIYTVDTAGAEAQRTADIRASLPGLWRALGGALDALLGAPLEEAEAVAAGKRREGLAPTALHMGMFAWQALARADTSGPAGTYGQVGTDGTAAPGAVGAVGAVGAAVGAVGAVGAAGAPAGAPAAAAAAAATAAAETAATTAAAGPAAAKRIQALEAEVQELNQAREDGRHLLGSTEAAAVPSPRFPVSGLGLSSSVRLAHSLPIVACEWSVPVLEPSQSPRVIPLSFFLPSLERDQHVSLWTAT